jgi:hypothetical protein
MGDCVIICDLFVVFIKSLNLRKISKYLSDKVVQPEVIVVTASAPDCTKLSI